MKKEISISIKGAGESVKEFVEAWRHAEHGKPPEQPVLRGRFYNAYGSHARTAGRA